MNRWDRLLESYLEEYGARGLAQERVDQVWRELSQWGNWLKRRRPRPKLEEVDADLIIGYVRGRTAFRAKATLSGVMSTLRGMGDFLVRQQLWLDDPSVPSPWPQVLACGVKSMELIPLDMISSGDASAEATGRSSPMHGSTGRAGKELMLRTGNPRLILLRVIWSEGNQPALERTLVVR